MAGGAKKFMWLLTFVVVGVEFPQPIEDVQGRHDWTFNRGKKTTVAE